MPHAKKGKKIWTLSSSTVPSSMGDIQISPRTIYLDLQVILHIWAIFNVTDEGRMKLERLFGKEVLTTLFDLEGDKALGLDGGYYGFLTK